MDVLKRMVSFRGCLDTLHWRLIAVLAVVACAHAQTLKQVATIDLPRPKGQRFDYLTMDDLSTSA